MRVIAFGETVTLEPSAQLGDGGEAVVFRHGAHALKIWHEPTPARVAKVEALVASGLPPAALAPVALVHDATSRDVVGFAMEALPPAYEPVALLGRKARLAAGLGTRAVVRVVRELAGALETLHAAGVVVGDLNDQNEVFDPARVGAGVRLLDVDSFHVPGHPCVVATEAYLDPRLYGPDLAHPVALPAGSAPRAFGPSSDRYALAVILFRALTLVHPFGGTHPSLPTLARRAHARVSVFSRSVAYPRAVGLALDVLGDELARALRSIFDDDDRRPVAGAVLERYAASLTSCPECAFEYPGDGRACPSCAALAPPPVLAGGSGSPSAEPLLELAGPVLALVADDASLACASLERGRLVHRRVELDAAGRARGPVGVTDLGPFAPGAGDQVALGPDVVAIARPRPEGPARERVFALVAYAAPARGAELAVVFESTTEGRDGKAAFGCGRRAVFRLAAGHVVAVKLGREPDERVLAQVIRGGTRLVAASTAAGDAVVAFERALGVRTCTWLHRGRALALALAPTRPGDAVDHEHALVDPEGRGVVVLRAIRRAGEALVATDAFDASGALVASRLEPEAARLAGASLEGLARVDAGAGHAALVVATQAGLARERVTPRGLEGRRLFAATEPFVTPDAALCALPGGAVASAVGRAVRRLEPR